MDYLLYVEHRAEDLQFFLWYYNYIPRWNALMPRQKLLSPVWEPEKAKGPKSRFLAYRHQRARSEKMNKILSVLDKPADPQKEELPFKCPPIKTSFSPDDDFAQPGTPPPQAANSPVPEPPKPDWCTSPSSPPSLFHIRSGTMLTPSTVTVQPFRNEYCGVIKHYIVETSPRALKLSKHDRQWCLDAAPHTTHPSALLPAFLAVEENLRTNLHPNFIRWTRSNSNRASMLFLRAAGVVMFLLGAGMDVLLILSGQSRFLRVLCLILWWPGLTVFIAACKDICLLLHYRDVRELRPWEIFPADSEADQNVKDVYVPSPVSAGSEKGLGVGGMSFVGKQEGKPSMRTFGPKNNYDDERWYGLYKKRSVWSKVLDKTTPVRNPTLRAMQDRTIFYAVLWGGLLATTLVVGSLIVPPLGIIR